MKRRRQGLQVSTFPFLAVLLCAMGSLILLLLVLDRRAKIVSRVKHQQAIARRSEEAAEVKARHEREWEERRQRLRSQLEEQIGQVEAQIRTLEQSRKQAADRLAAQEAETKEQLEARKRAEQARLAAYARSLEGSQTELRHRAEQTKIAQAELTRLAKELLQLEETLTQLKELRKRQAQTYSLVPYRGKRGDSRKPLYVECKPGSIVFHPDRAELRGADVEPATIAREIEKRLQAKVVQTGLNGPDKKNAYLLLLVRPDGIMTYYRTLSALQGLQLDYGYELVDADWQLDFAEESLPQEWMATKPLEIAPSIVSPKQGPSSPKSFGGFGNPQLGSTSGVPAGFGHASGEPGTGFGIQGSPASGAIPQQPGAIPRAGPGPQGSAGVDMPHSGVSATGPTGATGSPTNRPTSGIRQPMLGTPSRDAADQSVNSITGTPDGKPAMPRGSGTGAGQPGGSNSDPPVSPLLTPPNAATEPTGNPASSPVRPLQQPGVPGTGAGNGGTNEPPAPGTAAGEPSGTPGSVLDTIPDPSAKPNRKPAREEPRLVGGRDWVITIECKADEVVLHPGQRIPMEKLGGPEGLPKLVTQMIARRQASVRPGQLPYRPLLKFRVQPDGLRTYHMAYPLLEPLGYRMTRENVEQDPNANFIRVDP